MYNIFILYYYEFIIFSINFYYKKSQKTDFNPKRVWEVFDKHSTYFSS